MAAGVFSLTMLMVIEFRLGIIRQCSCEQRVNNGICHAADADAEPDARFCER